MIRIDGFEGGALPAKAQIRSIRISRDQFAAEYHSAGGVSIEIITQPGLGPIRYYSNFVVRDDALSGRSPFVRVEGPGAEHQLRLRAGRHADQGQELVQLSTCSASNAYDTPNLNAALADRHASPTR